MRVQLLILPILFVIMAVSIPFGTDQALPIAALESHQTHSILAFPDDLAFAPAISPKVQNIELVGHIGGATYAVFVQGNYAYVGEGYSLTILNVSNPSSPVVVGKTTPLPGIVQDVYIANNYAYIAAGALHVVDISNPAAPVEVGSYDTLPYARSVVVDGDYAYVANYHHGLRVLNVSNPTSPIAVGSYLLPGGEFAHDVAILGGNAFVAYGYNGLRVVDVSNPASPSEVGIFDQSGNAQGVAVAGNYAFIARSYDGLRVVDISNPASPSEVGFYDISGIAHDVNVIGNYAYVAYGYDGLRVVDISNPASPTEVGFHNTPWYAQHVVVVGSYAYVTDWNIGDREVGGGLRVINISDPTTPIEVGFYDVPGYAQDIVTVGDYAYIADGARGLYVLDISNPARPVSVGSVDTGGFAYTLAVAGNYVYLGDRYGGGFDADAGFRVIDVSNPANPIEVAYVRNDMPSEIFVAGNYAYVADYQYGLGLVDISDPPNSRGRGLIYDASGGEQGVVVVGNYAYLAADFGGLFIVNAHPPHPIFPYVEGSYDTPGHAKAVAVAGNTAYVADEGGGVRVVDLSNPSAPVEVGFYNPFPSPPAQNIATSGGYAYVVYGTSGLRVLDVYNPTNPTEVGLYDTLGNARSVTVTGNYIYVADREGGVYILHHTGARTTYSISGQVIDTEGNPIPSVAVYAGVSGSATTDSNGDYTISGLVAGTYTLLPSKYGYTFSPPSYSVNGPPDRTEQDFSGTLTTASAYVISGQVTDSEGNPISGVTISAGSDNSATTDSSGAYIITDLAIGTYTVTPFKSGFTFSPVSRSVNVPPNATGENFVGTSQMTSRTISGRVLDVNDNPISGVILSDGAGHTDITDSNGNYILSGLTADTYTITPSKSGYTFGPDSLTVSVPPNASGMNFKGYDKPPIVFVHGWRGLAEEETCGWTYPGGPDDYFEDVDNVMRTIGGYHTVYALLETSPCYTPLLVDNVINLQNAIATAKATTNQQKVILIAHSMGGLVSRAYIEGPNYEGDVKALFTFGSPHLGVPSDLWAFFFNGLTLGVVCADYQPVVCDMSILGMAHFNRNYRPRTAEIDYHLISGDAPFFSREPEGRITDVILPGGDDGIVTSKSGRGDQPAVTLDRFETDEVHNSFFGSNTYFNRDGGQKDSYTQCLKPLLIDKTSDACGNAVRIQSATAETSPTLNERTVFEYGTLLASQLTTRTIPLEGGPTLFATRWQTATLTVTLVDPNGQMIDPAYAASHLDEVIYDADSTNATYYFHNALAGQWQLVLQGHSDVPPEGSEYTSFSAFESAFLFSGETDPGWYAPGATATIDATILGATASATITGTILTADDTAQVVNLSPIDGENYQATFVVPNVPGYAEIRLAAIGTTSGGVAFERGRSLVFQISPNSMALNGVYSDAPQPHSPGSSFYEALIVTVGIDALVSGEYGLSADLVDANGSFVAHSLTIEEFITGSGTLALRFEGDDIYDSQQNGPYNLTNLLLTSHQGTTLVVAEAEDAYTTAAYDYHSFGDKDIYIYLPVVLK